LIDCADKARCIIPDALIDQLRQNIACRRIEAGLTLLASTRELIESFDGECENAAPFLGYLAQWVDIGYADASLVKKLLCRIDAQRRSGLPVTGYLHVQMAEGLVAMAEEEQSRAIPRFETVLLLGAEIGNNEIAAIAHFWKARCHRARGEYDAAFTHTVRARDLATACGYPRMAAVIRVLESWLYFQRGKHRDALATLQEAETVLAESDDYVTLGNIQSTYGRIYRQESRLDASVERFSRAIEEYRKRDPHHPNLARTLSNIAYVQRLMALQLRKRIDADTARRRGAGSVKANSHGSAARDREMFATLRQQAFAHLDEAGAIYKLHHNHRGAGTVSLHCGFLHYDNGELDLASRDAARAYELGSEKNDYILKARGRILQCMVENAILEEGVGENADPRQHAQAALDYARDAVDLARHTENQRLLGRAFTWRGLTMGNEFFGSLDAARELMHQAESYIHSDFHDTAWEDLEMLKHRVLQSSRVHHALQAWSMGMVGDKTLQQITEDFAAIIIPKVWELEGKKISRVAARLSVSPKKVRRILMRAGLLGGRRLAGTAKASASDVG
jgi:tetratricopeptide (TPR) repeat protein